MKAVTSSAPTVVVPYTRGKERSRTSDSVLAEARQMADLGLYRYPTTRANVNAFSDPLGRRRLQNCSMPSGRFLESVECALPRRHPRHFGKDIATPLHLHPAL